MLGKKLAIDLGADRGRLMVRGDDALVDEPAVTLALDGVKGEFLAGRQALRAVAADPIRLPIRPLRRGAIADDASLQAFLLGLIHIAVGRPRLFKPDVVVAVRGGMPGRDRRLILDILAGSGTRTAYLLDAPMAAALGAGLTIGGPGGQMVADIGADVSEVAVLAQDAQVVRHQIDRGGDDLAVAIRDHVAASLGGPVSAAAGVELLRHVASAQSSRPRSAEIRMQPAAELHEVRSLDIAAPVDDHVGQLLTLIGAALAESPRRLRDDVMTHGLVLCGGGALLDGLAETLSAALGMPVRVAADPTLCAVRGAGLAAESLDVLKRNFMYIR